MEARKQTDELSQLIIGIQKLQNLSGHNTLVRIESEQSTMLLLSILNKAVDDLVTSLPMILEFLIKRWEQLHDTAALHPYNQQTRVNRACVMVAIYLHTYKFENVIIDMYRSFDQICAAASAQLLEKTKTFLEARLAGRDVQGMQTLDSAKDNNIFRYLLQNTFENHLVEYAMDVVPQKDWKYFLDGILAFVKSREQFIKIVAKQVRMSNWAPFLEAIDDIDLYRTVLELDLNPLCEKYEKDKNGFDAGLLDYSEKLFQSSAFKLYLTEKYKFENEHEVRALMFVLFEIYRRIRAQRDDYTSAASYVGSLFSAANSKESKIGACNVLKEFVLNTDSLGKLDNYLQDKRLYKHKNAMADGTLKALIGIMTALALKTNTLAEKATFNM